MLRRWTDERLDDLAKVVYHNDGRLDEVAKQSDDTTSDVKRIVHAAERRSEHTWAVYLLLIGILATEILQLAGAHL